MPILSTAQQHFRDDLRRSTSLCSHAASITGNDVLADDILRSSWMFAVGAADAFFCDAYGDLLARTLQAYERQTTPPVLLPQQLRDIRVPVLAIVSGATSPSWKWRMAARDLIEREDVLSLGKIRTLLNKFCRDSRKLGEDDVIDEWISHPKAPHRLFSISFNSYSRLINTSSSDLGRARQKGRESLAKRTEMIFQRRHDCIHNCDRPKTSKQVIKTATVEKIIEDIGFLVSRCLEHMRQEFPFYLEQLGVSKTTRAWVLPK